MTQLQMVYTLRSGTQERWRRLSQEVAGSRRAQLKPPAGKPALPRCRSG